MKNVFTWLGVALVVVGCIFGSFTNVGQAAWIELAGFAAGLAMCIASIIAKSDKKDWKVYVSIVGVTIGTILMIWGGVVKDTVISVITAVLGLMVILVSILLPAIVNKKKNKEK